MFIGNIILENHATEKIAANTILLADEILNIHTYLAQTPEIGQGLGRFLSCGARKQEQT